MTNIQKRFIFCTCGSAIGAVLAFQFHTIWWLIAGLSGLTGWIVADLSGFIASCLKVLTLAKAEIKAVIQRKQPQAGETAESIEKAFLRRKLCSLVFVSSAFAIIEFTVFSIILVTGFCIIVAIPPSLSEIGQEFFLRPFKALLYLTGFAAELGCACGIIISILMILTSPTNYGMSTERLRNDIMDTKILLKELNPFSWIPRFILLTISFAARHLENLIQLAHSDERTVSAVCFTAGTVSGFIAGRSFELQYVGGLIAMLVGALSGFLLAWLDWKILSLKLGWRTVKS